MPYFFSQMGIWAYPMLLLAVLLAVQIFRVTRGILRGDPSVGVPSMGAILVWGALAGVLGLLGSAVGISLAAGVIETAPAISLPVIVGGIKVALSTTVFGLLLLALALTAWLALGFFEGRRKALPA